MYGDEIGDNVMLHHFNFCIPPSNNVGDTDDTGWINVAAGSIRIIFEVMFESSVEYVFINRLINLEQALLLVTTVLICLPENKT